MGLRALMLAGAAAGLTGSASAAPREEPVAQRDTLSPAATADGELAYLVGRWDIVATTPGRDDAARVEYEVRPLTRTAWLTGRGRSEALGLDSSDVWGRDPMTGEIMRTVFDESGTVAVVRSPGWRRDTLVLEGEARSAGGVVRIRETIRRVSDREFVATWEAFRDGAWQPYSIERASRRATRAS